MSFNALWSRADTCRISAGPPCAYVCVCVCWKYKEKHTHTHDWENKLISFSSTQLYCASTWDNETGIIKYEIIQGFGLFLKKTYEVNGAFLQSTVWVRPQFIHSNYKWCTRAPSKGDISVHPSFRIHCTAKTYIVLFVVQGRKTHLKYDIKKKSKSQCN